MRREDIEESIQRTTRLGAPVFGHTANRIRST